MSNEQKTIDQLLSTGRELAAKATPGPWRAALSTTETGHAWDVIARPGVSVVDGSGAALIAWLRNHAVELFDALEAAERENKATSDLLLKTHGLLRESESGYSGALARLAAVEAERDAHAADAIRLAGQVAQLEAVVKAARGIAVLPDNTFAGGGVYRIPPEALVAIGAMATTRERRAELVLQAALDWTSDTAGCHFCDYGMDGIHYTHDPGCPLVCRLPKAPAPKAGTL